MIMAKNYRSPTPLFVVSSLFAMFSSQTMVVDGAVGVTGFYLYRYDTGEDIFSIKDGDAVVMSTVSSSFGSGYEDDDFLGLRAAVVNPAGGEIGSVDFDVVDAETGNVLPTSSIDNDAPYTTPLLLPSDVTVSYGATAYGQENGGGDVIGAAYQATVSGAVLDPETSATNRVPPPPPSPTTPAPTRVTMSPTISPTESPTSQPTLSMSTSELIRTDPRLTTVANYLVNQNAMLLVDTLVSQRTVFLPSNDAFAHLDREYISMLQNNASYFFHAVDLIRFHVSFNNDRYYSSRQFRDASPSVTIPMLQFQQEPVLVVAKDHVLDDGVTTKSTITVTPKYLGVDLFEAVVEDYVPDPNNLRADVTDEDVVTTNSWNYIINRVLLPPWYFTSPLAYLQQYYATDSNFLELFLYAGIVDEIDTSSTFGTFLVVTNDYLTQQDVEDIIFGIDNSATPENDMEDLRFALRQHLVLPMLNLESEVQPVTAATTAGSDIDFRSSADAGNVNIAGGNHNVTTTTRGYKDLYRTGFVYYVTGLIVGSGGTSN